MDADADGDRRAQRIMLDLGLAQTPRLLVFNKQDRLPLDELNLRLRGYEAITISALLPGTTRPLLQAMENILWREELLVESKLA